MAIFHSYVSLPEGKYEWKNNDQPVDGMFFFRSPGFSDKLRLGERSAKRGDFTNKNVEMFMGNKHSQTFSFPSFPCISRVLYFPIFHIKLPERGFRRYSQQVLKHVSLLISISLIYSQTYFPYLSHIFSTSLVRKKTLRFQQVWFPPVGAMGIKLPPRQPWWKPLTPCALGRPKGPSKRRKVPQKPRENATDNHGEFAKTAELTCFFYDGK